MSSSAWMPIADGQPGIQQIVGNLNAMKDHYGSLPAIRAAAVAIAQPTTDDDDQGNVAKLASFVRKAVIYVKDPINSEFTQTPDVLLLQIHATGQARGDCDDHVLLFASLAESLGVFCTIAGVMAPGSSTYNHVIVLAYPDGEETQIDLCAKTGASPQYSSFIR